MDPTDAQLYEQASGGDGTALELLLERYLPQLHAFVRVRLGGVRARESSMDVVQSLCRDLLAGRERFEFRGEDRFRAWLFTSALNKLSAKHRFHRLAKRDVGREQVLDDEAPLPLAAELLTPSVDAIGKETGKALQEALAALSPEHREIITLARIVRLPHAVIAESTGRSEPAARQLLARAMRRLGQELKARGVTTA
ncbi:MAG TPA: sigma-70 family RNA polymerase sigma factor [Planctomycetota bacterium]|nr:sigma-70 family RNA polymerase sigma factor [Planctomycetota bacterium]